MATSNPLLQDMVCDGACGEGPPGDHAMSQCSRCKSVWYHDVNCQKKDWKYHKKDCRIWKKGKKCDPSEVLSSDLMVKIFSFVGGCPAKAAAINEDVMNVVPPEPLHMALLQNGTMHEYMAVPPAGTLYLEDAGKFYAGLAMVSKRWKDIMDESIHELVASVLVDLRRLEPHHFLPHLSKEKTGEAAFKWLCHYKKLKIQSIHSVVGYLTFVSPWMLLLQECNTTVLEAVHIILMCDFSNYTDINICQDLLNNHLILQECVRAACPNLKMLKVRLYFRGMPGEVEHSPYVTYSPSHSATPFFSQPEEYGLFSHPSLEKLCIWLIPFPEQPANIPPTFISELIQKIPNLKQLCIESDYGIEGSIVRGEGVIPIRSESLEVLDVSLFSVMSFVQTFSLDCPRLKLVRVLGGWGRRRHGHCQRIIQQGRVSPSCQSGVMYPHAEKGLMEVRGPLSDIL